MNVLSQGLLLIIILVSTGLIGAVIYKLSPVLTPFLIAATIAYFTDPLVEFLSQRGKVPRTVPVIGVFLLVVFAIVIILFYLIPALERELLLLVGKIPSWIEWVNQVVMPRLAAFGVTPDLESLRATVVEHVSQATEIARWIGQKLFHSGLAILEWLMDLLIVFVATFYFLRDWRTLLQKIKDLLPAKVSPTVIRLAQQCDEVLATFIRGQLTVMICLAVLYSIGLAMIGLNYSLLLGLLAGLLSVVPYLGTIIGLAASLVVSHFQFHDWLHLIWVLVVFGIGHVLEGTVLTPLLVGEKLGLHPVAVIFAVLAGGHLLGFVGVLIAIPVTAILVVIARYLLSHLDNRQGVTVG